MYKISDLISLFVFIIFYQSIFKMCHACHEVISQFFNDDDEEWQLNDAVKIDGKVYHRICARNVD